MARVLSISIHSKTCNFPMATPTLGVALRACSWHSNPTPRGSLRSPPPSTHFTRCYKSSSKSLAFHHTVFTSGDDQVEELEKRVREELERDLYPTATMDLIDTLQRLGVGYRFEEEINVLMERLSECNSTSDDLYATALRFRLLRHNGYSVYSDVFNVFINKKGKFKQSFSKDARGLLSLHEASYLGAEREQILSQAMKFTKTCLEQSMPMLSPQARRQVAQALDLPRHLRMARFEARNYLGEYNMEKKHNVHVLQLAKLDFNKVQSLHQKEFDEILRWWKQLGLDDKLNFSRDRLLECYLWAVGIFPEPYHSNSRIELSKTVCMLSVVDDIFSCNRSRNNELVLFNNAIRSWDLNAMEELPEHMKICYMALYNTTNEMGYRVLKEHGWNAVPRLRKSWMDIFEAFLIEAKWIDRRFLPMALLHSFFLMGEGMTEEAIGMMDPYPKLFSYSGGQVKNMSSEEKGRKHMKKLIQSLWKQLNGEIMGRPISLHRSIIQASLNLARTAQFIYDNGDDNNVEDHIESLLFMPIA